MKQRFLAAALLALFASIVPAQAARLFISEYNGVGVTNGVVTQIAVEPSKDQAPVDFSGGAATSAAIGNNASYVRVICDVQCSVLFGTAPTATTSNKLLGAGVPEYFSVPKGQAYKISVIANP